MSNPRKRYNAAENSARGYNAAVDAIRMEGVKAGRFLPLPSRPEEIKASPIVEDVRQVGPCTLYRGDCRRIVALLENISACVTDPPYELGFMGKSWDSSGIAADWRTWGAVRIALRPGAHLVAFAGSRTYHRIATAVDDAGFEVRDQIMWIYGSGFPKSMDVSKAVDKIDTVGPRRERALRFTAWMRATGITAKTINKATKSSMGSHYLTAGEQPEIPTREMFEMLRPHLPTVPSQIERLIDSREVESENMKRRPVISEYEKPAQAAAWRAKYQGGDAPTTGHNTAAFSDDARRWQGWGTALKPAHEPVVFARKPLSEGAVAANVLRWGTAALNIDASRIPSGADHADKCASVVGMDSNRSVTAYGEFKGQRSDSYSELGRWPANVLHDGSVEVLEVFPPSARDAIRFFYAPKADKEEREFGFECEGGERANIHPTVKPVDLMRWLCRLVTPPGGTVLDPFMGSGSTGIAAVREGFGFVGVEQDADYFGIACRRIEAAVRLLEVQPDIVRAVQRIRAEQGELL